MTPIATDVSAVASAKVEAEARDLSSGARRAQEETDKAFKKILEQIGV